MSRFLAAFAAMTMSATSLGHSQEWVPTPSSADHPPRKVLVGTVLRSFRGDLQTRLNEAEESIDRVVADAAKNYPGAKMDLIVLPEHAICGSNAGLASERAVPLNGEVLDRMGKKARANHTYLVVPMLLKEGSADTNVAVLLGRDGKVVGTYRKVHPVAEPQPPLPAVVGKLTLEKGITPGDSFPVFNCDFGKVGFQICWDGSYEDGWKELAQKGAEIVAYPSACSQNVRLASYALRGRYYVVNSTPKNNVAVFSPIGLPLARATDEKGWTVLTQQIDLSYVRLPWSPNLDDGKLLTKNFGDKAGYFYSTQEDTGLFWSNDPSLPIAKMIHQLNLVEMEKQIEVSTDLKSDKAK